MASRGDPRDPRFGFHVSVQGGLRRAAERAASLGCEALQIFARNPRMWRAAPIAQDDAHAFRSDLDRNDIRPCIIHTMYLINVASCDSELRERSIEAIAEDLRRASVLGCEYVVTHLGSRGQLSMTEARRRAVGAINRALRLAAGSDAMLLLENSAGQGQIIGRDVCELSRIALDVREPERIGFAVDSAHAFQAGYDVRTHQGIDAFTEPIETALGIERIRVVHLNDSMTELGSNRDRHEHIGKGALGMAGIRAWISHPIMRRLPMIMETPIDQEGDDRRNMRRVRRLARETRNGWAARLGTGQVSA